MCESFIDETGITIVENKPKEAKDLVKGVREFAGFNPDDLGIIEMRLGPDLVLAEAINKSDPDLKDAFTPEVAEKAFEQI